MIDLHRFGTNPFDDKNISIDEVTDYTIEHLGRMTADTVGGQLNGEIAATATALAQLDAQVTNETVKLGIQKARTAAKEAFRAALPNEISKLHAAVVMKIGQNSPDLPLYFPEGRDVFGHCNDSLLENKLGALHNALMNQENADPGYFQPETLLLSQELNTTWTALFGAASAGRAGYQDTADERRAKATALKTQLFKNLLKIASLYAGQVHTDGRPLSEVRIEFYCPQHLLEDHPPLEPEGTPPPPPPTPPSP
jgi:hypothetical protein